MLFHPKLETGRSGVSVYPQNLGSTLTNLIMLPLWGQFRSISINGVILITSHYLK